MPTPDGLLLDGYYVPSRGKKGFIYIHGMCSRTKPIEKVDELSRVLPRQGYHLLFFNNRGSGTWTKISLKDDKKKTKRQYGGSFERFEECVLDIRGAVSFLKKKGCSSIYLCGHSTGCQKSAYYLINRPDRAVKGVILLAPLNDTEAEIHTAGRAGFSRMFRKAQSMVKRRKRNEWLNWASAGRFYDLHRKGSKEGKIFDYTKKRMADVAKIRVPILTLLGDKDQYMIPRTCQEKLDLIQSSATSPCTCIMIKDADHGFKGHHKKVVKHISDWLKRQK